MAQRPPTRAHTRRENDLGCLKTASQVRGAIHYYGITAHLLLACTLVQPTAAICRRHKKAVKTRAMLHRASQAAGWRWWDGSATISRDDHGEDQQRQAATTQKG
jgi:hypothetical protein